MSPIGAALITLVCTLAGAALGMWLRGALPSHHLNEGSRETMKLGIGLVATMTALILGLVTASAKNSFDLVETAVRQTAMDLLTLDRLLARYGPETKEIRQTLQRLVEMRIDMVWPHSPSEAPRLDPAAAGAMELESVADLIRRLTPGDEARRSLQARAGDFAESLLKNRWMVSGGGPAVSLLFLVVLLFWLTITFASFGVYAPRNSTVFAVFLVCALSVSSAIFLILEMDGPFDGVLKVSADPLRYALARLNR